MGRSTFVRGLAAVLLLLMAAAAGSCQVGSRSGRVWSWLDGGRIARDVHAGTTSRVERGRVVAPRDRSIEVRYDVAVREGAVHIDVWRVLTPWRRPERLGGIEVAENTRGNFFVHAAGLRFYEVRVRPVGFGGRYDVSWSVE